MHQPIINCYEVEQMLLHPKRRNKFVIAAPISICCPEPDTDNALSLPEHNHLGRHWLCTVDLKPLLWIHNPVKIYRSLQSFQFMPDNILNCIPCVPCQTNIIQTVQCACIQDQDTLWSWFILSCTWDVSLHYHVHWLLATIYGCRNCLKSNVLRFF